MTLARASSRAGERQPPTGSAARGLYRPAWAWLVLLLVLAVTLSAAVWQYRRGVRKELIAAESARVARRPAQPLKAGFSPAVSSQPQWVSAQGLYTGEKSLLLDGQTYHQTPGYHVLTPLTLADGSLVMVDRGWVPQDPSRRRLPVVSAPADRVTVQGWWAPLPVTGFKLATDNCRARDFPRVVEWPTLADIACIYHQPPLEGRILLAPDAPYGFTRAWSAAAVELPPSRHYAYALQWLGFAAAAVLVFVRVGARRRPAPGPRWNNGGGVAVRAQAQDASQGAGPLPATAPTQDSPRA